MFGLFDRQAVGTFGVVLHDLTCAALSNDIASFNAC